jgi:hypothetical protein
MAQFICPSCGSEFFLTSKTGSKTIFKVASERVVQFIQSPTKSVSDRDIDLHHICCGACSWQGSLDELVQSHTD